MQRGVYDCALPTDPTVYIQGDLSGDAATMYSCISRFETIDAVIHAAAIPDPSHTAPHVVFQNNIMSTFHVIEACVRLGITRLVNLSSETVPGLHFPQFSYPKGTKESTLISGGCGAGGAGGKGGVGGSDLIPGSLPLYCPIDEKHPIQPHDPYALSKHFGEQMCDAAIRRRAADPANPLTIISIRPSWCQDSTNIARNLGPLIKDTSLPQAGMWSYIIIQDLARAIVMASKVDAKAILAYESDISSTITTVGAAPNGSTVAGSSAHQVIYISAADNIGSRDLAAAVKAEYGDSVPMKLPLSRPDASGLSIKKAETILGWVPKYSWSDFLTPEGDLKEKEALPK
jgi:UDP-glucose 4-epimerase